jgi:DNA-binding NtrC family response regulator
MAPETQAKVLRVLQERAFERVGGTKPIEVDVRVVAATHRDLEAEVKEGRFREDLYYRLKVVEVEIPPLRERLEDVPLLVDRVLDQLAARLGREKAVMDESALARLVRHPWPGNVRELRNVVEQAAVLASGQAIEEDDLNLDGGRQLPADALAPDPAVPFADAKKRVVERFERDYLLGALRRHGGNISRTAEAIGMVRQSLQQKIRELGLRDEDWSGEASG